MECKLINPLPLFLFFVLLTIALLFAKIIRKSIDFIKNTLSNLAKEAGLSINWNKIKAYFSKNTPNKKLGKLVMI